MYVFHKKGKRNPAAALSPTNSAAAVLS